MTSASLRKWHRWISVPAALFLLWASCTGVWLAGVEFFGADEALREKLREQVSPVNTQTPDADFAAALAKARAAVAEKVGVAPLDKVLWQMKGDEPTITFFLGKPGGGEDRQVVVNANTGAVLRIESYTDKPFLLRLHSGEAFGDGGLVGAMLWGFSLVVLTLSGIWIYMKMKPTQPRTGLRKIFWAVALTATLSLSARADSPFYTDDPNFSPGWEIKMGATAEHNSGGDILTEVLDWNYAVVPNVRLNLTTYTKHHWPSGGTDAFGYGDTEFKIKWRFLDEDPKSWRPAIGIAPKVYFPTAETAHGLGDGVWRFQIPLQFGKTVGKWYHWGEAGYQWAFDETATDMAYAGIGTLYNFTPHFALGTELFGNVPMDTKKEWNVLTTLGAIWTFNEHWSVKASVSHALRDAQHGGPAPSGVFYLVWNF